MKHIKFCLLTLGVFCMFVATAAAQEEEGAPLGPSRGMTLDMAKKILAGAEKAACTPKCAGGSMVVVDNAGYIIAMETLDNTQSPSITMAIKKAQTAALWLQPTTYFREEVAKGTNKSYQDGSFPDMTTAVGGVPIKGRDGRVIGGFGVSGARGHIPEVLDGAIEAIKKLQL